VAEKTWPPDVSQADNPLSPRHHRGRFFVSFSFPFFSFPVHARTSRLPRAPRTKTRAGRRDRRGPARSRPRTVDCVGYPDSHARRRQQHETKRPSLLRGIRTFGPTIPAGSERSLRSRPAHRSPSRRKCGGSQPPPRSRGLGLRECHIPAPDSTTRRCPAPEPSGHLRTSRLPTRPWRTSRSHPARHSCTAMTTKAPGRSAEADRPSAKAGARGRTDADAEAGARGHHRGRRSHHRGRRSPSPVTNNLELRCARD
jgi:hypothetical protein